MLNNKNAWSSRRFWGFYKYFEKGQISLKIEEAVFANMLKYCE